MIDEKRNKEATEKYLEEEGYKPYIEKAFQDGAQWAQEEFVKSLWHDVSEKPMAERLIIAITKVHRVIFDFEFRKEDDWAWQFNDCKIERWAYLDDILPKKGGEE